MFTSRTMCVFASLACLAGYVSAASPDWAVVQGLAAGEQVQLNLKTGKTLNGNIDHVTVDAVYLQTQKEATTIRRDEIRRLYVKTKRHLAMPILIGAAAGAAAGGALAPRIMEHETGYGGAVAGTVVLFAGIGAGVGCLARGSGKSLVYESPAENR